MKKLDTILIILGSVAVVFVIFAFGVYVGYRKAIFAAGRSDNYYRDFMGGTPAGFGFGFSGGMPANTHGIVGTVVEVASSSIVVRDQDNDEESVEIASGTVIRAMDQTVDFGSVVAGEGVAVIGDPNGIGQIEARFIRIFPASSSMPLPPQKIMLK